MTPVTKQTIDTQIRAAILNSNIPKNYFFLFKLFILRKASNTLTNGHFDEHRAFIFMEKIHEGSSTLYKVECITEQRSIFLLCKLYKPSEFLSPSGTSFLSAPVALANEITVREQLCHTRGIPPYYGNVHLLDTNKTVTGFLAELYESTYEEKIAQTMHPLNASEVMEEFKDIACAVAHVHEIGYAHLAIKTKNLLCKEGMVHLSKFSYAKCPLNIYTATFDQLEDSCLESDKHLFCELQPEKTKTKMLQLAQAVDVYAMGCIFERRGNLNIPELDFLIERMKEPNPHLRISSSAVAAELERISNQGDEYPEELWI